MPSLLRIESSRIPSHNGPSSYTEGMLPVYDPLAEELLAQPDGPPVLRKLMGLTRHGMLGPWLLFSHTCTFCLQARRAVANPHIATHLAHIEARHPLLDEVLGNDRRCEAKQSGPRGHGVIFERIPPFVGYVSGDSVLVTACLALAGARGTSVSLVAPADYMGSIGAYAVNFVSRLISARVFWSADSPAQFATNMLTWDLERMHPLGGVCWNPITKKPKGGRGGRGS